MPNAVIYARLSRDDLNDGLGVDRQVNECRKLARRQRLDVVDVLVDNDVSAYCRKTKRPQFERLVTMLHAGAVDAVVALHTDRLYRRTTDLERLVDIVETTGAQVHTVSSGTIDLSTASGRMIARMLGAAAQHESERLGERERLKADELAAAGKPPGGRPPYGYSAGYAINRKEADALHFMARRILEGSSCFALARELDAKGIRTREGRPWHSSSVRASLVNPAVAGLRVHRREIAGPGNWEPVLDRATWEEVRAVLMDPARKRTRPARKYLLAGLVFSSKGDQMNGRSDHGAGGALDRRTYSTRYGATRPTSIGADQLEETVVRAVLEVLDKSALPTGEVAPTGVAEVEQLEAEMAELAALRGAGEITVAEWLAARKPLEERIADARKRAGTARRPSPHAKLLTKPGAVRRAWPNLDFAARRDIIGTLVERVRIGPATRARHTTLEERLDPANGGGIDWRV